MIEKIKIPKEQDFVDIQIIKINELIDTVNTACKTLELFGKIFKVNLKAFEAIASQMKKLKSNNPYAFLDGLDQEEKT